MILYRKKTKEKVQKKQNAGRTVKKILLCYENSKSRTELCYIYICGGSVESRTEEAAAGRKSSRAAWRQERERESEKVERKTERTNQAGKRNPVEQVA